MIGRRGFLGTTLGMLSTVMTGFWGLLGDRAKTSRIGSVPRRAGVDWHVTHDVKQLLLYVTSEGKPIYTNWWTATFKDGHTMTFRGEEHGQVQVVAHDQSLLLATDQVPPEEGVLFMPAKKVKGYKSIR